MTARLKTTEIVDQCISMVGAAVDSAAIDFAIPIIQEGDLAFYIENEDLPTDLPACFVKATQVDVGIGETETEFGDVTGTLIVTTTAIRLVLVDAWTAGVEVVDRRQDRLQQIAEVFAGDPGLNLGGVAIAGYTIERALPQILELEPPENLEAALAYGRQVYAVAATLLVRGRANR